MTTTALDHIAARPRLPAAPIVRHGITLYPFETLSDVVSLYLDHSNGWRLHTSADRAGFRGYALQEFDTWTVMAWCEQTGFRFRRKGYKTEAGAVRALSRQAAMIEA